MKIKISEIPEFDAAEYLTDEEEIAAFLTAVLEDDDPALLTAALGDVARARRMNAAPMPAA
jgi:probable addiction module antidote protein